MLHWLQQIRLVGHLACSFHFRFPILEALSFLKMQKLSCVGDITHRLRGILGTSYVDRHPIRMTSCCAKLMPLLNLAFQITALTAFSSSRHSDKDLRPLWDTILNSRTFDQKGTARLKLSSVPLGSEFVLEGARNKACVPNLYSRIRLWHLNRSSSEPTYCQLSISTACCDQ